MTKNKTTIRERTIACLENILAKSTLKPDVRRAATLRLTRLRAHTTGATSETLAKGKMLARQTYVDLWCQRAALIRKRRRTAEDNAVLNVLVEHLPTREPAAAAQNSEWVPFVGAVTSTLEELKSLR